MASRHAWQGPILGILVCSAVELLGAGAVVAAPNPSDMALAEALFRTGRELMEAKSYSQACPKLAESYRLDPKLGTLLNVALCQEADNKTASAWGAFNEAAQVARRTGQLDREKFAQEHAKALEPSLSRVIFKAESTSPGEQIELDGRPLGAGLMGTPLPLDPGPHKLEASGPHKTRWERVINVARNAAPETIVIPALKDAPMDAPVAIAPSPSATPSGPTTPVATPADPEARGSSSSRRTVAYVLGGVGIVAVGVGAGFGIKALASKSDRDQHCPQHMCDSTGQAAFRDGRAAANVSTAALSIGGAMVGAGLILLLTAPSNTQTPAPASASAGGWQTTQIRPSLGRGLAGLELEHGW